MSPDDIDTIVLRLHDFLTGAMGCNLDENEDYSDLSTFMYDQLDSFVTKDRNYN